jgi:homoserine/homoserine lactone efflux protein
MFGCRSAHTEAPEEMIDVSHYLAFLLATSALMLIPGPNVALIVANSVAYGTYYGLLTVAGTGVAMLLQLALTAVGMTAALGHLGAWLEWIRWIGVAYLLWLGIRQWRAPPVEIAHTPPQPRSAQAIFLRGLLVSLTNPKTLLFYSAFFPQFIAPDRSLATQLWVLVGSFLALAILIDGGWATLAGRARTVLAARGKLRNRMSGGMLIGAGLGLALARRS